LLCTIRPDPESFTNVLSYNIGRAAVEFEKKAHADNLLQSKAMEKNMIAVASEIERLRGELVNAEKRATAVTTAAAVTNPGTVLNLYGLLSFSSSVLANNFRSIYRNCFNQYF
jgi:hypothetical protein